MKYTVEVDRENCIACAACYGINPNHFEGDADGKSRVVGGITNSSSSGAFAREVSVVLIIHKTHAFYSVTLLSSNIFVQSILSITMMIITSIITEATPPTIPPPANKSLR